jgi:hypothetical protein
VFATALLPFVSTASAQLLGGRLGSRLDNMREKLSDKNSAIQYDRSVLLVATFGNRW